MIIIKHIPLKKDDDIPNQQVLGPNALSFLFTDQNIENIEEKEIISDSPANDKKKSDYSANEKVVQSKPDSEVLVSNIHDDRKIDSSLFDQLLHDFDDHVKDLDKKKAVLSELDTSGSILLTVIDSLKDLNKIINEKNRKEIES